MGKKLDFACGAPEWLRNVEDKKVFAAVFGLILSHKVGGEPFTEEGLKKELADLGDLSEKRQKEAFDLMMAHRDKK